MDIDQQKLDEIYKLAKDNNRMLHSMRRSAFFSGLLRFVWWAVILGVGAWISVTYVLPVMNQMITTMNAVQQGGAQAQVQLQSFQNMFKDLQGKIPGLSGAAN